MRQEAWDGEESEGGVGVDGAGRVGADHGKSPICDNRVRLWLGAFSSEPVTVTLSSSFGSSRLRPGAAVAQFGPKVDRAMTGLVT